jgi:DivIVA domain-containing protein
MRDALTPDELANVSFPTTLRGYDRDEVDAFLHKVQAQMKEAERQRAERLYAHMGEEIGDLLQHAKDSADEMKQEAESDAAKMRADATADASRLRDEAGADAHTMRADAEADAKKMRQEAESDAAEIRAAAERDAERRTKIADDRVRELEGEEAEARTRIKALRTELESVASHLRPLEGEKAQGTGDETETVDDELAVTAEAPSTIRLEQQVEKTPT